MNKKLNCTLNSQKFWGHEKMEKKTTMCYYLSIWTLHDFENEIGKSDKISFCLKENTDHHQSINFVFIIYGIWRVKNIQ